MTNMKELNKRDAIMAVTQVINMSKYTVIGHESGEVKWNDNNSLHPYTTTIEMPPKGTTNIMVIYLKR